MNKLFDPNSKIMQYGYKLFDLMFLQLLVLLFSLPLFTAGAAFTAMHNVLLNIYRDQSVAVWREFWSTFKSNFKQSAVIWLLALAGCIFLYINYRLIVISDIPWLKPGIYLLAVPALYILLSLSWVFVLQSRYENPVGKTLRNALMMVFAHPLNTVVNTLLMAAPLILLFWYQLFPIVFFLGFTLPGILRAMLYSRTFDQLEGTNWRKDQEENR